MIQCLQPTATLGVLVTATGKTTPSDLQQQIKWDLQYFLVTETNVLPILCYEVGHAQQYVVAPHANSSSGSPIVLANLVLLVVMFPNEIRIPFGINVFIKEISFLSPL